MEAFSSRVSSKYFHLPRETTPPLLLSFTLTCAIGTHSTSKGKIYSGLGICGFAAISSSKGTGYVQEIIRRFEEEISK